MKGLYLLNKKCLCSILSFIAENTDPVVGEEAAEEERDLEAGRMLT